MASVKYEYDLNMVREMALYMENDEIFYDSVRVIKELYFGEAELDASNVRIFNPNVIAHAARYAFTYFASLWNERESEVFLQAEYFKACQEVIPELMESCD